MILTTERVPTSTDEGATLFDIISEMKLEVMPMMATMDAAWAARQRTNVDPSAPWLPSILAVIFQG